MVAEIKKKTTHRFHVVKTGAKNTTNGILTFVRSLYNTVRNFVVGVVADPIFQYVAKMVMLSVAWNLLAVLANSAWMAALTPALAALVAVGILVGMLTIVYLMVLTIQTLFVGVFTSEHVTA